MRFLFGLILGAVLTLFVATAFNVPTHALVDKGKASWDDFLLATGSALFEFPKAPAALPEIAVADQSPSDELLDMNGLDFDADLDADTDTDMDADTAMSAEKDMNVHLPPAAELPMPLAGEPKDLDTLLAGEATPMEIEPHAGKPAIATDVPTVDLDPPTQSVWVPFRSQMSAQGFARRLTGKLDHPFSVNREGPGRYQVIFSYANEFERLAVLDQVQSVTGQDPR